MGAIGLGIGIGLSQPRRGGGTPAPTPTPSAPDAPVLSSLSSGWTTGDNPPNWDTTYSGTYYDPSDFTGDGLRIRLSLGGGAVTTEAWVPFDIAYLTDGFTYPFLTDGTLNAGGTIVIQVQAGRNFTAAIPGAGTPALTSAWSNTWTDTLNPAVVAKWAYNAAPTQQVLVFGDPAAVTFTNESFGVGTGVVLISNAGNRGMPSGVTIGGVAATLAKSTVDSNSNVSIWVAASASAGNKNVVVTFGSVNGCTVGIATGTLAASINATPTATTSIALGFNPDPQTSPSFTLPANGVALAIQGAVGDGVTPTWSVGTANAERHGANGDFMFGTASQLGGGSSSSTTFAVNGFAYAGSMMAVAIFGP